MVRLVIAFAYVMVFLSGMTGLIYQVVWQKYLSIYLGSHASATSLVLSAFFLYLAIGYFVFGKVSHKLFKNKLILYGVLELLIGAYALVSPDYFHWLKSWFLSLSLDPGFANHFIFTSLFLAVPTFLMGGTIPVLTEGLSTQFDRSHRVHAYVYGLNTAGAFVGTLAAGFFLIEAYGLPMTLLLAGILNILIFVLCYGIARLSGLAFAGPDKQESPTQLSRREQGILYTVSFFSGFYVFSLEALIIRMAGIVTMSSSYTYSIIVAAFIVAIALGSFLAARFDSSGRPQFMITMQASLLLACTALYFSVPFWPDLFGRIRSFILPSYANVPWLWLLVTIAFLFILIIPVGLMGMNLPLLFGYLRSRREHLSSSVGRLYAANSIGSVLGAAVGGYALFFIFDAAQVYQVSLAMILVNLLLLLNLGPRPKARKAALLGLAILPMTLTLLFPWPAERFVPNQFLGVLLSPNSESYFTANQALKAGNPKIIYSQFDPNTYVTVVKDMLPEPDPLTGLQQRLTLYVNAKPDASHPGDHIARVFLPLVAAALSPKVDNVFIVGLGAGLSTAVLTSLSENQKVEVAEISSGVIEALPHFDEINQKLTDRSGKFKIIEGDAYQVLMSRREKYDVILSEPSNPWVSGVDKLFSIEFLRNIADHLSSDGLFAQWFPANTIKEADILEIIRTATLIFPNVTIWNTGGGTISIVASFKPHAVDLSRLKRRYQETEAFQKTIHLSDATSILGRQLLPAWTVKGLATRTSRFQTLEHPTLSYSAARSFLANIDTRFGALTSKLIKEPVPKGEPRAHFLYEEFNGTLPEQFYKDTIGFVSGYGRTTSSTLLARFEFEHQKYFPRSPVQYPTGVDWTKYILGAGSLPNSERNLSPLQNARNALIAYSRAKEAHLSPSKSLMLAKVDLTCDSRPCLNVFQQILQELLPTNDPLAKLKNVGSDPEAKAKILGRLKTLKGQSAIN